jgi:hypothetical protein
MARRSPYKSRVPNYNDYKNAAERYLEIERKMRNLQKTEKEIQRRIYGCSNEMARISRDHLGLLGHRVVDQLRKEREEAE